MLAFGRAWQYAQPPRFRSGTFQENQHVSVSHQRSVSSSSWKSSSAGTSARYERSLRSWSRSTPKAVLMWAPWSSEWGPVAVGENAHGRTGQLGLPSDPAPQREDVVLLGHGSRS